MRYRYFEGQADRKRTLRSRKTKSGALLNIRVKAGARKEGILGLMGDHVRVAVQAPPVEGAANRALIRLLARSFRTKPSAIRLVRGLKSKDKTVEFESLTAEALQQRLAQLIEETAQLSGNGEHTPCRS